MTRFVVDAGTVLHLAGAKAEISSAHKLLAPTLLRSQTLSALHEAVQRGEIPRQVAREHLTHVGRMPIRLLGDAVLRRHAWDLADQLGWASTYNAEYVALTQLHADAFITLDTELARSVQGIVATASVDELLQCLHVILDEEWEHSRYANRDLAVLETRHRRSSSVVDTRGNREVQRALRRDTGDMAPLPISYVDAFTSTPASGTPGASSGS